MRLFLSSFRFGAHRQRFLELAGRRGRVAVVANAADSWPPRARASAVVSDVRPLQALGFEVEELDLRKGISRSEIAGYDVVWVRGGNTFVLRAQLRCTGADAVLVDLLAQDAFLYAGYSAGACIMCPSLDGLESMDDPGEVFSTCGVGPIREGLGLVDRPIVPHCGSDPKSDALARRYRDSAIAHWALTDADAVVVTDATPTLLRG